MFKHFYIRNRTAKQQNLITKVFFAYSRH